MFVLDDLRHDTRNSKVEVISLLYQGDGKAIEHAHNEENRWRLE
jgi:hypothetical protein